MGDSVDCHVFQEVLALYFTRTRARPGEKVKVGAIVKDVKDGAKVHFIIKARDTEVGTVDADLKGGKCEAEWTIKLPKNDWNDHDFATLACTVDGKELNNAGPESRLLLDLALPKFSM
jgi:hypothetical protein